VQEGESEMSDKPVQYRDISEREVLRYALDYTMPWIIDTFKAIPDDHVAVRPRPNINAPGYVFGHIAVTERKHVGMFLESVKDIPEKYMIFFGSGGCCEQSHSEDEIRAAIESKNTLISYWQSVREKTRAYLDRISDADLKTVPEKTLHPDNHPNRHNPIREWFVMTIQHQNCMMGWLEIIKRLFEDK